MEEIAARLSALEFIVEVLAASALAEMEPENFAALRAGIETRAFDGTMPNGGTVEDRAYAIRQNEMVGAAIIHRMARLAERTAQIRKGRAGL